MSNVVRLKVRLDTGLFDVAVSLWCVSDASLVNRAGLVTQATHTNTGRAMVESNRVARNVSDGVLLVAV